MRLIITIFILHFVGFISNAQNIEFSPLSRYGVGDLQVFRPAATLGLGLGNVAFAEDGQSNPENPASYGFLRLTAAEISFRAKYKSIEDNQGIKADDRSGNLEHITVGIPLRNSINDILDHKTAPHAWGVAFGLSPYSNVGYNYVIKDSTTENGRRTRQLLGSGSINRFFVGVGYRKKQLSFGLNAAYLFGTQRYDQSLTFNDILGAADNYLEDKIHSAGFQFTFGSMYKIILNKNLVSNDKSIRPRSLNFGLTLSTPSRINQTLDALHYTRLDITSEIVDTILNVVDKKEKGTLPLSIKLGAYYNHKEKLGLSAELGQDLWKNAELHSSINNQFENVTSISAGAWWRPDITGYGSVFKRTQYKLGMFYQSDYRNISGNVPSTIAATLGLAIPVVFQRQAAIVHLGIEAGKTNTPNLFNEEYIKLNLAFTLTDNEWFLKRRYE